MSSQVHSRGGQGEHTSHENESLVLLVLAGSWKYWKAFSIVELRIWATHILSGSCLPGVTIFINYSNYIPFNFLLMSFHGSNHCPIDGTFSCIMPTDLFRSLGPHCLANIWFCQCYVCQTVVKIKRQFILVFTGLSLTIRDFCFHMIVGHYVSSFEYFLFMAFMSFLTGLFTLFWNGFMTTQYIPESVYVLQIFLSMCCLFFNPVRGDGVAVCIVSKIWNARCLLLSVYCKNFLIKKCKIIQYSKHTHHLAFMFYQTWKFKFYV